MDIFEHSEALSDPFRASILTLGVFDGVHLGHQQLVKQCVDRAHKKNLPALAYTFDPHPVKILFPEACPQLLQTREQKLACLESLGIDIIVVEPFTKEFSQYSANSFFKEILQSRLHAQEIIVGYDFTFGAARKGTTQVLSQLGRTANIPVHVMDAFFVGDHLVSSTVIRQQVQAGHIAVASTLLGRPFQLSGKVIDGDGMGQQLGFATANLQAFNELIPAHGVYATTTHVNNQKYISLTNIGVRPTFNGTEQRIETHLLNFDQNIRGQTISVDFLECLREEKKFSSPEELVAQIHQDIETAQKYFQEHPA